jgi:histidyl-tRNA synthetase
VGDAACRPRYLEVLRDYFRPRLAELCEDCQRRFERHPLLILDCKREACHRVARGAPQIFEYLCDACAAHVEGVKRHFDLVGVRYSIDPFIVRGLDYYTRTAVEVYSGRLGAQNAMFGGGRYDGLAEQLGGPPTPGVGFGFGLDRLLLVAEQEGTLHPVDRQVEVMVVPIGPNTRQEAIVLLDELRGGRIRAEGDLLSRDLRAQLKHADRIGARYALMLGDDELAAGSVTLREMASGQQTGLPRRGIVEAVRTRLRASAAGSGREGGGAP